MGFSIFITICSLAGLLFCFRRASTLLPRNLTIPLQMFGQNNNNSTTRGPIALSDDDLEGATRIDWDELDAQFEDIDEDGYVGGRASGASGAVGGQVLKPVTRQARYLDDNEDDEGEGEVQPFRTSGLESDGDEDDNDAPFVDDEDDDDNEESEVVVESALDKAAKKDRLFSLEDEEREHEN
ncbi:MAG: hypothetical protein J3R72DRAFT_125805 [Linnemannia gamsii]|nr:MAG: hypothetical protein J3R72DRAFT_125805 [Linnemannia gamsii]